MADYDLFVIGAGSGGVACARRAGQHGAKVALAERSRVGGTCVVRGCVPKKLMSLGAHYKDLLEIAPSYGWEMGQPTHDFTRLLTNRNQEIARLSGIYEAMLERSGGRLLLGSARITGRDGHAFVVEVEGEDGTHSLTATHVLVAAGGSPVLPPIPGIEHAVTSDFLLEQVYERPARVAVVGAGYIGLEQSSIFLGLGCETHLVMRQNLPLGGFDQDLRMELTDQLERRGMKLHRDTKLAGLTKTATGIVVEGTMAGVEVDMVLMATGRRPKPNTAGLGLEALDVALDPGGAIKVDFAYATKVPGLHAVGDACDHAFGCMPGSAAERLGLPSGQFDLTPVAIAEGRAVAERLFNANPTTVDYGAVPTAVFAIPQAASVGLTEGRARQLGHSLRVYRSRFRPLFYTLPTVADVGREERTMMKLVIDDATDRVLGAHMVGDDAAEIIQGLAVAVAAGVTKAQMDATLALHPTSAEEFVTMWKPVEPG